MEPGFIDLVGFDPIDATAGLTLPRAQAVVAAVLRTRDYDLVEVRSMRRSDGTCVEAVIVDVECDGVPPKNVAGILYRERLALLISGDDGTLPEVLALRSDFPILMHQNHGTRGGPASLCLYFEPPLAVLRSWTPERFLRRIQWWLEQSARGELHPADQPPEGLFFASRYELVLPWNLATLIGDPAQRFVVVRGEARPDGGLTCLLRPAGGVQRAPQGSAAYVHVQLPPVQHGFVERDPATLGELSDLLLGRGADLLPMLNEALAAGVTPEGAPVSQSETFVVILVSVPLVRSAGGQPERVSHRAFLVLNGRHKLGVATGALHVFNNRYFRDSGATLGAAPATEWRTETIFPMDVLQELDAATARLQSRVADAGPVGTLVGAGSLGSALANLWGRAAWGTWSVVDKDHIKPHNLARHVAFNDQIGKPKSHVVSALQSGVFRGAGEITAVIDDACNVQSEAVRRPLESSDLVVDASAALEYPRASSREDTFARHISVFITPNGDGSVLMAEDANRSIRLRTLEAQYYRALMNEPWGDSHLAGDLQTFWSGRSCRDISVAMPYSRITAHASTLAEQVITAHQQGDARVRVWQRDGFTGSVQVFDVLPARERAWPLGDLTAYADEGVLDKLKTLRAAHAPRETGGVLLGYVDLTNKWVVIVDALPAPADSESTSSSFERGTAGLAGAVQEAARRTAGNVEYIGEWHSHPPGHSAQPSRADLIQLAELALKMSEDGLPVLQLIVGEDDIQLLQGTAR